MIVVSDTSPISNLHQIGRLGLLRELFGDVVLPGAVAEEISALDRNRSILADNDWITVVELQDRESLTGLAETLDKGEAEAIALALEISADAVLIDEAIGRKEALRRGLNVTGIIGVLLRAKQKGLIPAVEPVIGELVTEAGFWLDPVFVEEILRISGER